MAQLGFNVHDTVLLPMEIAEGCLPSSLEADSPLEATESFQGHPMALHEAL